MKLLILGGTIFLGRHLIEAALERGHEVTIFNRGLHGKDLYPDVEKLRGQREIPLIGLHGVPQKPDGRPVLHLKMRVASCKPGTNSSIYNSNGPRSL